MPSLLWIAIRAGTLLSIWLSMHQTSITKKYAPYQHVRLQLALQAVMW